MLVNFMGNPMASPIAVIDPDDGGCVEVLDLNESCRPYGPNDRCGGCDECMYMQACHGGGLAFIDMTQPLAGLASLFFGWLP